jgi:coenzyme F420-reducing hydrogenase delta subunit
VVFIDFGINPETYEDLSQIKALFIVTDCNKQHTIPLSIWLNNQTARPVSIRIIRDIVSGKIRPRYIDSLLQAGQKTQMIAKYDFPINEIDYSSRLLSQYDDVFPFAKISKEFKSMLLDCITEIFEKDRNAAIKAIRKAQIGG